MSLARVKQLKKQKHPEMSPMGSLTELTNEPSVSFVSDTPTPVSRTSAEHTEYEEAIARLCAYDCPTGIPAGRWQLFIQDAQTFISRWGTHTAEIGFTPAEMLAPPDENGRAGFVWHLHGRPVINIEGGVFYIGEAPLNLPREFSI